MKLTFWRIMLGIVVGSTLLFLLYFSISQKTGFFNLFVATPAAGTTKFAGKLVSGKVVRDVAYCGVQKLDLYLPRTTVYETSPTVIFIHGGGWHSNSKNSDARIRNLVDGLRDKGYTIASIDYRETPRYQFPDPAEDALCAVRFLRAQTDMYQLDGNNFAVFGFSAGGNLAAMIGVLPSDSTLNNGQYRTESSRVKAVVTLAGVFDFTSGLKPNSVANVRNLMQKLPVKLGAPISYVTKDDPPFLLIRGDKDSIGLPAQEALFAAKLKANNVPYEQLTVKNGEHDLSRFGGDTTPSYQQTAGIIQEFIQRQLGK